MSIVSPSSRQPIRDAWTLERLIYERSLVLGFALETTTASAYDSHLNSYINFCHLHGRPIEPTEDTLSFYVVWLSHHIEPRSVDSYLLGIAHRLEDLYPNVQHAHCSSLVSCMLCGCKHWLSQPVQCKPPLHSDDLLCVSQHIGHSPAHNDKLFLMMLVTILTSLLCCRYARHCEKDFGPGRTFQMIP